MAKVVKTLRSLREHLQVGASVRNVRWRPVDVGGRTVIPITRVSCGFGPGNNLSTSLPSNSHNSHFLQGGEIGRQVERLSDTSKGERPTGNLQELGLELERGDT